MNYETKAGFVDSVEVSCDVERDDALGRESSGRARSLAHCRR